MAIIRFTERPNFRNPWAEFERIRQGLDRLSSNFTDRDIFHGSANVFPPINLYEDKEALIVKAEIPGVNTSDLSISLEGDTLSLEGKRNQQNKDETVSFHRREIERGSFSRSVSLPTKIDPDTVAAKLKNGILTITISKAAEVKPRQITISTEE